MNKNELDQGLITQNIEKYNALLANVEKKLQQKQQLNQAKAEKQTALSDRQTELSHQEDAFAHNSFTTEGRSAYLNFVNIVNSLDWQKLKEVGGKEALVNTLRTGIETDFSELASSFTTQDYEDIVNGYINIQGSYAYSKAQIQDKLNNISPFGGYGYYGSARHQDSLTTSIINNNKNYQDTFSAQQILRYANNQTLYEQENNIPNLELLPYPTPGSFKDRDEEFAKYEEIRKKNEALQREYNQKYGHQMSLNDTTFQLIEEAATKKLSESSSSTLNKILTNYTKFSSGVGHASYSTNSYTSHAFSGLKLPPIKVQISDLDLGYIIFHLPATLTGITSDLTSTISKKQIDDLKRYTTTYSNFLNNIDFDSSDWLQDKSAFKTHFDRAKAFYDKVQDLTNNLTALETAVAGSKEQKELTANVIRLRKEIKDDITAGRENGDSVYILGNNKTLTWSSEVTNAVNAAKAEVLPILSDIQKYLRPYDPNNKVIQAVKTETEKMGDAIANKRTEIAAINDEIKALETQIASIKLTPEEDAANDNRTTAQAELDKKKAEYAVLQTELEKQRNILLGLNNTLQSSPLTAKGENALAQGTDAFASGKNSIAFGTESTASAENAVAMGNKSVASGKNAIAIGNEAQALKESAIAIGNKAIVNGESAVGIGDQIGVSGNKAVGIGANSTITGDNAVSIGAENIVVHKNAVAIGTNITQTAENSVNLGNASAATTQRTEQTAGTTDYNSAEILGSIYTFAAGENIQGVVTVGDKGKERRIQNVAAGLISPKSTDAVNGSQLYQMAKAVDDGRLGLVKQDPNTQLISVAGQRGGNLVSFYNNQGEVRRLTGIAEGIAQTDAINKAQFDREVGRLDGRVNQVERDVKKIKGSVSTAVAMANMPTATRPGQSYLSAGTGYSNGTTAISVGLSHLSDNGRITYKFSGGASQRGNVAFGAGIGFAW
ncbi:YadA-like family protein [Avibacterium volantium]|uniref:YadA-like family protein n=1 Tax=Avibacterium volantium TaxID=762 RepID=UPI000F82B83B|nr:YadA-like family protein [Avibacterium volantium]